MAETLIILLLLLLALVLLHVAPVAAVARPRCRQITLRLASIHYEPKTKLTMTTNLRSPVSQFAQILLQPADANGKRVKLDPDAIIAPAPVGTGASTAIVVVERPFNSVASFAPVARPKTKNHARPAP